MKKKRPDVHEGIISCLKYVIFRSDQVDKMICLYAIEDSICPAKAITKLTTALKFRRKISPELGESIDRAIANLRTQLAEHEAEAALASENKAKAETLIKEVVS